MGNYYASARSNYFKVKDMAMLIKELSEIDGPLKIHAKGNTDVIPDENNLFCLLSESDNGWPTHYQSGDEVGWSDFFERHLSEGEIAIVMESGGENKSYVSGFATAYTSNGDGTQVCLDDIYQKVERKFGIKPTRCHY